MPPSPFFLSLHICICLSSICWAFTSPNRNHKNVNNFSPFHVKNAECVDIPLTTESSVHLKLTQIYDVESDQINLEESSAIEILEYVDKTDNTTVLACVAEAEREALELFSLHTLNENLTSATGIVLQTRRLDLSSNDTTRILMSLWGNGKLLSTSKDYPFDTVKRRPQKENLLDGLSSHILRMKRLQSERNETDAMLANFIHSQNFDTSTLQKFRFDDTLTTEATLVNLKSFLIWFRQEFPYYYDGCCHCGNKQGNRFYGFVHPQPSEGDHQARITELYTCGACRSTTRFPRYNRLSKVLETRRGRCGEYSVLLMRLLHVLGYTARWTVDVADHVWAEVRLGGSWVHCDPCEAAVDEPLIYQGWGKNQTLILSFTFDDVEDVTLKYTTDHEGVATRREAKGLDPGTLLSKLEGARNQLREQALAVEAAAVAAAAPERGAKS